MHCSPLKFWYCTHLSRELIVKRAPRGGFKGVLTPISFFFKCKWVFRCQWTRWCGWSIFGALAMTTARAAKTWLLKWIRVLSDLTLSRFSSTLLKMPNVGDFPWSWILIGTASNFRKGRKPRSRVFMSSIKRRIRTFHVLAVQGRHQTKLPKSLLQMQNCCWLIKTYYFFDVLAGSHTLYYFSL